MSRSWLLVLVLGLMGCATTSVVFKPYSAKVSRLRPLMSYAIVAYEGDVDTLAKAGGEVVGALDVGGNGFAGSEDVRSRAMHEAARAGGTHLLIAREGSSTSWAQITPDRATTAIHGNTATTTYTPGVQMPITRPHGTFVVVRVPPARWLELPTSLRPIPGRHFEGRYPKRRPAAPEPDPTDHTPSETVDGWFCTSDEEDTMGLCFRTAGTCDESQQALGDHDFMPCAEQAEAACFSSKRGESARLSCHPTMPACRAQRDHVFAQGFEIVRECTSTP